MEVVQQEIQKGGVLPMTYWALFLIMMGNVLALVLCGGLVGNLVGTFRQVKS